MKQQTITNKETGQRFSFIRSSEDLLEIESVYAPKGKEPIQHYHPFQIERFTILEGKVTVRINGRISEYLPGDVWEIKRGAIHSMWNSSDQEAKVNWQVTPAMNTEESLRTLVGLANDGKTNDAGVPRILQIALTARKYSKETRLAKPPYVILNILLFILSPLAYLTGCRATYKKYHS